MVIVIANFVSFVALPPVRTATMSSSMTSNIPASITPPTPTTNSQPLDEIKCHSRHNHGNEGRPILLRATHFQVRMPRGYIHHYDVSIVPDKCPRRVNR